MLNRTVATDARFNKLTVVEQWLFMRMLPFADDRGRLPGNLIELRLLTIPGSNMKTIHLEKHLKRMDELELIYYDKDKVVAYRGWFKNQTLTHPPAKSPFPEPRTAVKTKVREPDKIPMAEKPQRKNVTNTFDDFWKVGFKMRDKKRCQGLWLGIPDKDKKILMQYARKFIKGKKGSQLPYTFLSMRKWEKEAVSPKDFKKLPNGFYQAYCSSCGKEIFPKELQLEASSICCDAALSPERPFTKLPKPKFI